LEALIAFLPSPADGAIGALDWSSAERKRLAAKSVEFCCPSCGRVANLLPTLKEKSEAKPSRFQKEIEQLRRMQTQEHNTEEEANVTEEESKPAAPTSSSISSSMPIEERTPFVEPSEVKTPAVVRSGVGPAVGATSPQSSDAVSPPVERVDVNNRDGYDKADVAIEPAATQPPTPAVPDNNNNTNNNNNNNIVPNDADTKSSWLVEPALQMAIVVLSGICFLLLRKIQALCAELQALEE